MSGTAGSHLATTKRESKLPINEAKAEEVKLTLPPHWLAVLLPLDPALPEALPPGTFSYKNQDNLWFDKPI